jgi:hypothetical protein
MVEIKGTYSTAKVFTDNIEQSAIGQIQENKLNFNLNNPNISYLFGLMQTDGSLGASSRNRGKLQIELQYTDKELLENLQKIIPYNSNISTRIRNTNFKQNYKSCILSIYNKEFRNIINKWGIPYGKKSSQIKPPTEEYLQVDYFRGIIDGDGSLGMTNKNFPFISLITASEFLATAWINFIQQYTGKKKQSERNKRDNVYNICITKEDAQIISEILYYKNCLCMSRKHEKALLVSQWIRPNNMKKNDFIKKRWTTEEDIYILNHNLEDSMIKLHRTKKSIDIRLWRLKKQYELKIKT